MALEQDITIEGRSTGEGSAMGFDILGRIPGSKYKEIILP